MCGRLDANDGDDAGGVIVLALVVEGGDACVGCGFSDVIKITLVRHIIIGTYKLACGRERSCD